MQQVDALCIDQRNKDERNDQVLGMQSIYRHAKEVVAYVGPEDNRSSELMSAAADKDLYQHIKANSAMLSDFQQNVVRPFFARPYWTRLWIVQEIALAASITVICGSQTAPWNGLCDITLDINHNESYYQDLRFIRALIEIRERAPLKLYEALHWTRQSACTLALDKVFGLLGITTDGSTILTGPDYDISEKEMCKAITMSYIQKLDGDIIFLTTRNNQFLELPSWCPNYLYLAQQPFNFRIFNLGNSKHYLTSHAMEIKLDNCFLETPAFRMGTIQSLGWTHEDGDLKIFPTQVPGQVHHATVSYDIKSLIEVFETALCTTFQGPKRIPMSLLFLLLFRPYREASRISTNPKSPVRQWLDANQNFIAFGKSLRDLAQEFSLSFSARMKLGALSKGGRRSATESVVAAVSSNLRLMTLDQSIWGIGWAHPDALLGDEVFMLPRCSIPAIMRLERNKQYRLVGAAMVGSTSLQHIPESLPDSCSHKVRII